MCFIWQPWHQGQGGNSRKQNGATPHAGLRSFQTLAKPTASRELAPASPAPLLARTPPKQVLSEHTRPLSAKPLTPAGFYPRFKRVDLASESQATWCLWYGHLEEVAGLSRPRFPISGLHPFQGVCAESLLGAGHHAERCELKDQSDARQQGKSKGIRGK